LSFPIHTYRLGAIEPLVAVLLLEGEDVGVLAICPRPDGPVRPDRVPPLHKHEKPRVSVGGRKFFPVALFELALALSSSHLQRRCAAVLPGIRFARALQGIRLLGLVLAMILFRHSSSFAVDQRCKRRKEERRIKEKEEEERG